MVALIEKQKKLSHKGGVGAKTTVILIVITKPLSWGRHRGKEYDHTHRNKKISPTAEALWAKTIVILITIKKSPMGMMVLQRLQSHSMQPKDLSFGHEGGSGF